MIQRTRVRSAKLRTGEEFVRTIVVEPPLARLEARDDRVPRRGVVFRCVLTWRTVTAADVTAFGASAKMKPPPAPNRAFDTNCSARLRRGVDTIHRFHVSCRLATSCARIALPNLYNIAIRIASVTAPPRENRETPSSGACLSVVHARFGLKADLTPGAGNVSSCSGSGHCAHESYG